MFLGRLRIFIVTLSAKPCVDLLLRTEAVLRWAPVVISSYLLITIVERAAMSDQPILTSLPVPTQDERTMAFLAHLLQVFTGFIAPLVIFCVKQDSRFVKFHALQSLIWQLCYMALLFGVMIFFFFSIFAAAFHGAFAGHTPNGPPPAFIFLFPFLWLFWLLGWVANVVLGVLYGIKANRGEWAGYPIIGNWCLPKTDLATSAPAKPSTPRF
jgi:uncharacterized Tic20 family protein